MPKLIHKAMDSVGMEVVVEEDKEAEDSKVTRGLSYSGRGVANEEEKEEEDDY